MELLSNLAVKNNNNTVYLTIQSYKCGKIETIDIVKHNVLSAESIESELVNLVETLNYFNNEHLPIQIEVNFNPQIPSEHFVYLVAYSTVDKKAIVCSSGSTTYSIIAEFNKNVDCGSHYGN